MLACCSRGGGPVGAGARPAAGAPAARSNNPKPPPAARRPPQVPAALEGKRDAAPQLYVSTLEVRPGGAALQGPGVGRSRVLPRARNRLATARTPPITPPLARPQSEPLRAKALTFSSVAGARGVQEKSVESDVLAAEVVPEVLPQLRALLADLFVPLVAAQPAPPRKAAESAKDEFVQARALLRVGTCVRGGAAGGGSGSRLVGAGRGGRRPP